MITLAVAVVSTIGSVPSAGASMAATTALRGVARGSEYVALGDSYAAGYGLGHATGKPVAACGQSSLDYPHRLARRYGLDLRDVTCAGATTADVVSSRQYAKASPQVDALSSSTRLVTLTIGGNDAGLFSTAASCLALSAHGPVFSGRDARNCKSTLVDDGEDTLTDTIETTVRTGIASAVKKVRAAAPNAVVVMVGYPAIFPDKAHTPRGGCFRSAVDFASLAGSFPKNTFPFTNTDVRYLAGVQRALDAVTAQVADRNDIRYVSTYRGTLGHSACAGSSRAYVSGVSLTGTRNLKHIDLAAGALHPDRAGAAYLARRVALALG